MIDRKKKIVITGANGYLGQALLKDLSAKGYYDILAIDIAPIHNYDGAQIIVDIMTPHALDDYLSVNTLLFHFAGHADVASSVVDPIFDFQLNVVGLMNVLESVRKCKCEMIYPSTSSIFELSKNEPLSEVTVKNPSSPYGASKMTGEAYCKAYSRSYGLNIKIARFFSVYGPTMNRFAIYDIIHKIHKNNTSITIFGDGSQIRDYLYIDDMIRGLCIIAEKGKPGEDYNLATGIPVTIKELTLKIAEVMCVPDIKIECTNKLINGEVSAMYADISKVSAIGFAPKYDFEDGLMLTINGILGRDEEK